MTACTLRRTRFGDLLINGIASDIVRQSFTNGIQADGSYQLFPAHTIRTGFYFSGETIFVGNSSLVEPAPRRSGGRCAFHYRR